MKNLFIIALMLVAFGAGAQKKYYDIDLSKDTFDDQTISLKYEGIRLVNKMPDQDYQVKIEVTIEPNANEQKQEEDGDALSLVTSCLDSLVNIIRVADDEKAVAEAVTALKKIDDECHKKAIEKAEEITIDTRDFYFELEKNQNIYITIVNTSSKKEWKVKLETPRSVDYISHFGFSFVPIKGVTNSDRYYSQQTGTNSYTITQMNNNGADFWKDISLTANYFVPLCKIGRTDDVRFGFNAGFGVSGNANFSVMAGAGFIIKDFISLTANYGVYNKYKLRGQYTPGQVISENLGVDQLNEQGLRPGLMLSLGFRLSKEQLSTQVENKGDK